MQAPAFRSLSPSEREVLLLLGTDISCEESQTLIQENDKVTGFVTGMTDTHTCDHTRTHMQHHT